MRPESGHEWTDCLFLSPDSSSLLRNSNILFNTDSPKSVSPTDQQVRCSTRTYTWTTGPRLHLRKTDCCYISFSLLPPPSSQTSSSRVLPTPSSPEDHQTSCQVRSAFDCEEGVGRGQEACGEESTAQTQSGQWTGPDPPYWTRIRKVLKSWHSGPSSDDVVWFMAVSYTKLTSVLSWWFDFQWLRFVQMFSGVLGQTTSPDHSLVSDVSLDWMSSMSEASSICVCWFECVFTWWCVSATSEPQCHMSLRLLPPQPPNDERTRRRGDNTRYSWEADRSWLSNTHAHTHMHIRSSLYLLIYVCVFQPRSPHPPSLPLFLI